MDPTAVDPAGISVPIFDEDPDEAFTGPEGIDILFNEESEGGEPYNGDYGDDDEYYDGDGSYQPEPLETSASQRTAPSEAGQAETVSGHTHSGEPGKSLKCDRGTQFLPLSSSGDPRKSRKCDRGARLRL